MKLITFFVRSSRSIGYSKRVMAIVIAAGIIGGLVNTAVLAVINKALASVGASVTALIWGFAALCLALAISKAISQILLIRFATGTIFTLRMELCRQILSSPLRHLEEIGSARLLATFTEDIPSVTTALTQIPNLCINFVIVVGCLGYMGILSWLMLVLVVIVVGIGALTYHLLENRTSVYYRLANVEWTKLLNHFQALVSGSKELKLHRERRKEFISRHVRTAAWSLARHRNAATTTYAIAENWGELLIFLIIGILLFALPNFRGVNTQILTGFVIAILYMTTPLQFFLNTFPQVSQADAAIDRIEELRAMLKARAGEDEVKDESGGSPSWKTIRLVGITHTYHREKENSRFTLGPIDLALCPGEMVFVTGGNGSGKTTLVKLLTGLYVPESGYVEVTGQPVTEDSRDEYRQLFSVVFSDFYLFDSLLGLNAPELDGAAADYLVRLQLNHKVEIKDGVLSTTDLSQGQRKRLALLTAYIEDRPIYVFDEWAADQDPSFRDIFYYTLLPELKRRGKTVVVVSHDDRYYHIADRLIKLDYGRLEYDRQPDSTLKAAADVPYSVS